MPRLVRFLFSFLAPSITSIGFCHASQQDPAFSQIDSIVRTLSEITGWQEKRPVSYGRMSKQQLRRFVSKRIKKTLRPEEIRADELALKMFGLVPQSFDLKKSTIDLVTEQAAAFYDYDEKKLFLLEDSPLEAELTTLAHELSHALADQLFDLNKLMDDNASNDDEDLAHSAVVEGQASWLMMAYAMKAAGKSPVPTSEMVTEFVNSSGDAAADFPVLKGSPLYIQESLVFPYTEGIRFFDAVYKRDGKKAFSEVFTDSPKDSAQIIHPERYFAHEPAATPPLPKLPSRGEESGISEGSLGEFDHKMLLRQYGSELEADELAPHLKGGSFKIVSHGRQHRPVLTYASEWESDEHAREFFSFYKKVLAAKWRRCEATLDKREIFAGEGDTGHFVTRLSGSTVTSIEGLSDTEAEEQEKGEELAGEARPPALHELK